MQLEFTPAAQRALAAAAAWAAADPSRDPHQLHVPEVLLGLLAEPECRSALILSEYGIDADAVRRQFSLVALERPAVDRAARFSPAWSECLHETEQRLFEYPRPLELATEQLLLGIAAADNEVARWLRKRGLSVDSLEAEVHRLSGHDPGPLPIEADAAAPIELPDDPGIVAGQEPGELPMHEQTGALRAIDAAANRAVEGLRVVEDYLRFVLDDRHLTGRCKAIRHDLAGALQAFPNAQRLAARDTRGDVGTAISTTAEQSRSTTAEVARASLKRVEQSLRSLEEFAKPTSVQSAARLEQLRYRSYTLERAVGITIDSLERLDDARLCVLVDAQSSIDAFAGRIDSLVSAGVSLIQLREKHMADRELLARARLLSERTQGSPTLFIMNDRPDLAVLAGADGVHVGQDELTVKDARRILGPRGLIGVSTHSLEQARAAVIDGANYIGVGPTFPSGTKQFTEFPGTDLLRQVAGEIRLPSFAIGGITRENLAEVLATGITRVAVAGDIVGSDDPRAAAVMFLDALPAG